MLNGLKNPVQQKLGKSEGSSWHFADMDKVTNGFSQWIANKLKMDMKREKKYYEEFLDWFIKKWNFPTDKTAPE